jgi:lipoprotein-anchoring transpeptidase ErfK/SrfK
VRTRRTIGAVIVALAAAAAAVVVLDASRASGPHSGGEEATALLPDPVAPAFRPIVRPGLLSEPSLSRWAPVLRPAAVRRGAGRDASVIAPLETSTPEGTTNIVLVLPGVREADGRLWVRVRLPILPNNSTGWVPREALGGYGAVQTRLVVDRERFTATLFRRGREIFSAPIGIGEPRWPTPTGEFYIRNKLTDFDDQFYGPVAFGTSARSSVLTDWPAGGFIGIHGTNRPELLPGRVSHGCIRLRNQDILRLARLMPIGTPLTVR